MYLSLFLHFILLGLFRGYLSSNPESVMVQSPEDNEGKSSKIQVRETLPKISAVSEIPRNVIVKVMRPVLIGSEVYWQEVDSGSFSRIRASSQYRDSLRFFRPSRLNVRRTTEKSNIDEAPVSAERFKILQDDNKDNRGIIFDDRSQMPESTYRGNSRTRVRDGVTRVTQSTYRGNSRTEVEDWGDCDDCELEMPQNTDRGKSGTKVGDGESLMPQSTYRGSSGTNVKDDESLMPQNTYKGNSGDNETQVPQSDLKGNRGTNSGDTQSPVPQTKLKGNDEKNDENDSTLEGKSDANNENDKSSVPDGKVDDTNIREVEGDTSHVFTENEEAFFEDGHQIKPGANSTVTARLSADSNFFAGIVNDFGFKLVESLNLESNFVISPLSIYIALSMCYLASDGSTKAQIEKTLGMDDNSVHDEHLHQGIKNLMSLITKRTSGYEIFAANGMFLGKNFKTEASFAENIKKYYGAEIKNLDFTNPGLSLEFINKWVSDNTRNMISKIINSPPPWQTRLLLLNAVFFKGIWKTQFPIHLTSTGNFQLLDETNKEVPYMTLFDEAFPVVRSDQHRHTFIKLPYEGDQVSMIIALPYTAREKPISYIRDQILCHMRDAMVNTTLDAVLIPKFRLEHRISLIRPLQKLGIRDIFNINAVDLKKLRKENDVYVSGFMHKSIVEIDEVGTKASASTAVGLVPLSYQNRTRFIASHPFAFYIIHEPTGLVLFYGKIFDFEFAKVVPGSNRREVSRGRPTRPIPNRRQG